MDNQKLAEEIFRNEEADAWFEYLEATQQLRGQAYDDKESWSWTRLVLRLRAAKRRRAELLAAA